LGEADHVREIVSPASFGVSNALNSVGGIRKEGDWAKSMEAEKNVIKCMIIMRNVFFITVMGKGVKTR